MSALENAAGPYRLAGYVITSQTDSSVTLRAPARRFSWAFFAAGLVLLWPVSVVYLVWFNLRRQRDVCLRVTSLGEIEASGFTLELLERERRWRSFVLLLVLISGFVALVCLAYVAINKG